MDSRVVVVLGGGFDPVHYGHLRAADRVGERLAADEVRFIPCGNPPHKAGLHASAEQRVEMLELGFREIQSPQRPMIIDKRETSRREPSYTVDTLLSLRADLGASCSLVFVMGWDSLQQVHTWNRWRELLGLANIVVVNRPGFEEVEEPQVKEVLQKSLVDIDLLKDFSRGKIAFLQLDEVEASSRDLRRKVAAGETISPWVPLQVCKYIDQSGLYRENPVD